MIHKTRNIFTVSKVNRYLKNLLNNDPIVSSIWVTGEISNFKRHTSGHLYFTLKDANSAVNCVMFKQNAQRASFEIQNGMEILALGYFSLYEKTGAYQLYAEIIEPVGIGAVFLSFEQLKQKLEKEGLFDPAHKKPIPEPVETIAVVTSPTGAAVRDIINITKRRNKSIQLIIVPALMQGDAAPTDIAFAISAANRMNRADCIVIARGGGSLEDLAPFNTEIVARAIYNSRLPVISAIGHEIDFTIADFTADLRAETPSAAAEMLTKPLNMAFVLAYEKKIQMKMEAILRHNKNKVLSQKELWKHVSQKILNSQIYLDETQKSLYNMLVKKLEKYNFQLINNTDKLNALSPLGALNRGYLIAYDEKKQVLKSINDFKENITFSITLKDGSVKALCIEKMAVDRS